MTVVLGILASIFNFWNKLPPTIKIVILLILFTFAGFLYGRHVEKVKCEAQKQESISEARRIDQTANATAFKDMEADKEKYRKQALNFENQYNEVVAGYTTLKKECTDADFIEDNNKLNDDIGANLSRRVPNKVPSSKPGLTRNREHSGKPGELQKGPSK